MMGAMTPVDSGMNRGVDNMSVGSGFGSRQPMYGGMDNERLQVGSQRAEAVGIGGAPKFTSQQTEDIRRRMQGELPQPMYGGLGSLGFNPMMGQQFGMPMGNFGYYR